MTDVAFHEMAEREPNEAAMTLQYDVVDLPHIAEDTCGETWVLIFLEI